MDKHTREKVALVVFALLVAFAAAVLIGYFTTGRSWSVAASFVDDKVGRMDGYTVVSYAGVVNEKAEVAAGSAKTSAEDAKPAASSSATVQNASTDIDDESEKGSAVGVFEAFRDRLVPENGDITPELDETSASEDAVDESGTADECNDPSGESRTASSIGLDVLALYADLASFSTRGVYVSDVRQIYSDKGASALTLDLTRTLEDDSPAIYRVGGKQIGVYGARSCAGKSWLAHDLKYFARNDVDIVIGVTPRTDYLATYEGTDVVLVTTDEEGVGTQGYFSNATFVVRSPEKGDIGVVVLTSNGTASSKVFNN